MAKNITQAAQAQAERIARESVRGGLGRVTGVNYKTRFNAEEVQEIARRRRELAERLQAADCEPAPPPFRGVRR